MSSRRLAFQADVRAAARAGYAACLLLVPLLLAGGHAAAQEGHPLKGSWIGEWESNETHGESVLLVLNWDGENITGVINPGTHDIPITDAELDPSDWSLRIEAEAEAEAESESGPVNYVIEGHIEDLELPSRRIIGTWRHGEGRGAFEVQRQ